MDQGEILEQGSAETVADEYLKRAHARGNERLSLVNRGTSEYPRWGSGEIEIFEVTMLDAEGNQGHVFRSGEPFQLRLRYQCHESTRQPVFGVGIYRSDGTYINGSNHHWRDRPIEVEEMTAGENGTVVMDFESMPLLAGQYYVTTFLYDHSKAAPTAIDHQEHATTFEVIDPRNHQHGMLYLPTRWTLQRGEEEGGSKEVSSS